MKLQFVVIMILSFLISCFDIEKFKKELHEKQISNNKEFRDISNALDKFMKWENETKNTNSVRGIIHGIYHSGIAIAKSMNGNEEGAKAEFDRAIEQFAKTKNLKNKK